MPLDHALIPTDRPTVDAAGEDHTAPLGAWIVETFYNTDPDDRWVELDDWSNTTLHGPFESEEAAEAFMEDFLPDDTDVKDMCARTHTDAAAYVNPVTKS